jgi:AcrR family transcriptional regulator
MISRVRNSHFPKVAMTTRPIPVLSSRKQPQQARSTRIVADILEAATQVLARDGAHRFTTARVAEKAGVSVGSLYQYFPNKEAILFRLQSDEWRQTGEMLEGILADRNRPPRDRLRAVVRAFVESECAEASLRIALGDAAPFYRDAPAAREHRRHGTRRVLAFMREAIPGVGKRQRATAADIMTMTLETVGKRISEEGRTPTEIATLANALGDMFCAYLDRLEAGESRLEARAASD